MIMALSAPLGAAVVGIIGSEIFREILKTAIIIVIRKKL